MAGKRRGGGGGSRGSSGGRTPHRRQDTGDSSGRTGPETGGPGVGTDPDALDTMAGRLDATRSRVDDIATTVRNVNVGPQSMGVLGSGFTGAAQSHLRAAEQHVARARDAVDQAHRGTRDTAAAYRDTDATSATNLSKIDSTAHPPTPAGTGVAPPGHTTPPGGPTSPDGPWHGPNNLTLEPAHNKAADDFLTRARRTELEATRSMQAISDGVPGSQLVGLEHRLKTVDSFKRKLAAEIKNNSEALIAEHLANMKDSVRYTMQIPDGSYTSGVDHAVRAMRDQGYEPVSFKNTWGGEGYKGINSAWRDPHTGHIFEVQFHTPSSFDAKMSTHGLYEQARLPGTDADKVRAVQEQQRRIFSTVPGPPGAPDITLTSGGPGNG